MDSPSHGIKIKVVDNGYTIDIGPRTIIFGDINKLNEWISENFNTPEVARESIRISKGLTKTQERLLDLTKWPTYNAPNIAVDNTGTPLYDYYTTTNTTTNNGINTMSNVSSVIEEKKGTPEYESMLRRIANKFRGW